MAVAAHETRQGKLKWLTRPIDWAFTVCLTTFVFGGFFWREGKIPTDALVIGLLVALGLASALLLWGLARMNNVARRY